MKLAILITALMAFASGNIIEEKRFLFEDPWRQMLIDWANSQNKQLLACTFVPDAPDNQCETTCPQIIANLRNNQLTRNLLCAQLCKQVQTMVKNGAVSTSHC